MTRSFVLPAAVTLLVGAAISLAPASVASAQAPATVHASPAQASQLLFVAGDVRRLSRTPSGTVDTVLEKVLQELYRKDPTLAPEDAKRAIDALDAALDTPATSTATLAVLPGNQRIIAILAALQRSNPSAHVQRALASVADGALAESSASARTLAREFNASTDSLSTLLYGSFSPGTTLRATTALAAANTRFGRARDALWEAASNESVFDSSAALVARNPALQNDAVRRLTQGLAADGSLTANVADVEDLARDGIQAVGVQTTVAIRDHRNVARECPGFQCQDYRDAARSDGMTGRAVISSQQATVTAAAGLLTVIDARYGAAVQAEAQAAAQVASAVNSYFAATDYNEYVHAAVDVVGLAATLAVAQVDPAAAITGVLNIVRDFVDIGVPQPDANALLLQGLQGVSKQLSAFAEETAAQFRTVDARLEALTRQVGVLANELSSQLAQARTQLTGLGNALSDLQGSVDRLHAEIQRLFADGARNNLRTLVTQSIGYSQINAGRRLPRDDQFAPAAAALFDNATATSLSETILTSPLGYDAPAAAKIGELDPSVNFFALFPQRVTDSPAGLDWPSALTDTCPSGNLASGRCLPDPDFWAVSSRAFAQLLLENRDYVTPAYITQLDATLSSGRSLASAFGRIARKDSDDGTGSRLFNAALGYYGAWVGARGAERPSDQPPALIQALRAAREVSLASERPAGLEPKTHWVDPWAGPSQQLGDVDLLGTQYLQNLGSDTGGLTIDNLRPAPGLISRLPLPVQNAVRLGIGRIQVNWHASWQGAIPAKDQYGTLLVRMFFRYIVPESATRAAINDDLGFVEVFRSFTPNCSGFEGGASAEQTFVNSWEKLDTCRDFGAEFTAATGGPNAGGVYRRDESGFARAAADIGPLVDARLRELQVKSFKDLLVDEKTLTLGDGRASNVEAAAERVEGAQALLKGYVTLGLPQALATDDTLRGLVAGDAANALLRPNRDDHRAVPAGTVGGQLVEWVKFHLARGIPQSDPLVGLGSRFSEHSAALEFLIGTYVKTGRAPGQSAADGGRLDESSPLVSSTLDRLELSRAVLADYLAHPQTPASPPASGGGASPAAPSGSAAPQTRPAPARARLIRAPRARRNTITFTVGCLSGTCRITTAVTAGRRSVARSTLSIKAGARRTVTVRVNAAGRRLLARRGRLAVTVRISLAGTARPLASTRVTLRGARR